MTSPEHDLRCERGGLLLSLRTDGAATPEQVRELETHLAACGSCRRAAAVDRAVGDRLRERAEGAVPAGFTARVVAAAIAQRAAAAAQNRFLRWTTAAAAAVLCAAVCWDDVVGPPRPAPRDPAVSDARAAARHAVVRPRFEGR